MRGHPRISGSPATLPQVMQARKNPQPAGEHHPENLPAAALTASPPDTAALSGPAASAYWHQGGPRLAGRVRHRAERVRGGRVVAAHPQIPSMPPAMPWNTSLSRLRARTERLTNDDGLIPGAVAGGVQQFLVGARAGAPGQPLFPYPGTEAEHSHAGSIFFGRCRFAHRDGRALCSLRTFGGFPGGNPCRNSAPGGFPWAILSSRCPPGRANGPESPFASCRRCATASECSRAAAGPSAGPQGLGGGCLVALPLPPGYTGTTSSK